MPPHDPIPTQTADPCDSARPTTPDAEPLPEAFGRYRVVKLLGQGGMGRVYLARDTALDRPVALKVPRFVRPHSPAAERFRREGRLAAALRHENLCPVYDVGEADGVPFLAMPYLDGDALSACIRRDGPWPPERAVALVARIARALAYAHAAGIAHRDLKPANVMLTPAGDPIVMDFGLSVRDSAGDPRLTDSGLFLGTPAYAAPEQVGGHGGPASDVYSLGVILYELLTGHPPFRGLTSSVLEQVLTKSPELPSAVKPGIDPVLDAICLTALQKDPGRRFASMLEFAAALEAWRPGEVVPKPAVRSRRPFWPFAVAGALALALVGVLAVVTLRPVPVVVPVIVQPLDELPVGSSWVGHFTFRGGYRSDMALSIESRDGGRFTGTATTEKGQYVWKVAGTLTGRDVRWEYIETVRVASDVDLPGNAHVSGTLDDLTMKLRYAERNSADTAEVTLVRRPKPGE